MVLKYELLHVIEAEVRLVDVDIIELLALCIKFYVCPSVDIDKFCKTNFY